MMERLYEEEMACRKKARITESSSDLFDCLPDDIVVSILAKLSYSARSPSDFVTVLLTYASLSLSPYVSLPPSPRLFLSLPPSLRLSLYFCSSLSVTLSCTLLMFIMQMHKAEPVRSTAGGSQRSRYEHSRGSS